MQDLALFSVASQRNHWLAARSAAVANNIANADTPGYKARDVPAFEAALASAQVNMARTSIDHMTPQDAGARSFEAVPRGSGVNKHSGNYREPRDRVDEPRGGALATLDGNRRRRSIQPHAAIEHEGLTQ